MIAKLLCKVALKMHNAEDEKMLQMLVPFLSCV